LERIEVPTKVPDWAEWGGKNIYGDVVMIDELNVLQMAAGERSRNLERRKPLGERAWLHPMRPGIYGDLDGALAQWRRAGVRFIISDSSQNRRRPYFYELRGRVGRDVELVKEFLYQKGQNGRVEREIAIYKLKEQSIERQTIPD